MGYTKLVVHVLRKKYGRKLEVVGLLKASINAELLKDSIEALSTLVDEGKFNFAEDGITFKAVDPANVAMVTFSLKSDAFSSYECDSEELGMDLTKLSDILGMAQANDTVGLELDEDAQRMVITFSGLTYAVSLLDVSTLRKEPSTPKLDLPAAVVMSGGDFRRAIRAAEKISDHIALGVDKNVLYMEAEGDTDRVKFELTKDQLISLKGSGVRSLYSLDYLGDMSKPISRVPEVTINLGKDYPVQISFSIADGSGSAEYLLAPRIESD